MVTQKKNNVLKDRSWPTLLPLCSSFPIVKRGCPILAFFARVGRDGAGSTRLVMPRGLHRYYGAHYLQFS